MQSSISPVLYVSDLHRFRSLHINIVILVGRKVSLRATVASTVRAAASSCCSIVSEGLGERMLSEKWKGKALICRAVGNRTGRQGFGSRRVGL
jgi:hypothetical protein